VRYDHKGLGVTREPQTLSEALGDEKWKEAMDQEFATLQKNRTWHLVPANQG
jgi:hypothetical protein